MIKSKYRKLLIISFAILFIIMSVMTAIMAENVLHTEHCNLPNCSLCSLIDLSTDFIKNMGFINIDILILVVIVPLIQLINKNIQEERKRTLVELKVIQNK